GIRPYTSIQPYSSSRKKRRSSTVEMDIQKELKTKVQEEAKAYHAGHRKRLKERYSSQGVSALADHELLELLLTFSIPHRDTKPYAKSSSRSFRTCAASSKPTSTVWKR